MFTKLYQFILSALLISAFAVPSINAADEPVKREMRNVWVATVWQLDWPLNTISETGNETQINRQKESMITLLDSMATNNMNAINFQIRGRCDAFYKSSYEPWSSDLVQTRGMDPGWDPLEFVVEECHKRGLECHAWINPYRYESVVGQWDGTPQCYREEHPDWLMDVDGASILNPGLPEVTQRIVDVIKEVIQNYDVDGVLFDDYFYLSGTPTSLDADLYNAYVESGGTMSQSDWRRENVNTMVASVYEMIQEVKPWVRFGISPAGVSCTSSAHANIYGVPMCPSGSDWQYSGIFSDPLAWISRHSLDFISPQIYWAIGHSSNDYSLIAPWWSEIAAKYDRHFFASHSISSLTAASKSAGMSMLEASLQEMANTKAIGDNTSFDEFAEEIRINRESTLNDAPGSIFYSCKYMYRTAPLFAHYLKTTVFNTPALVPAMTFKVATNPGNISQLSRDGNVLNWSGFDNVRYTVYAIPTSLPIINFNKEAEYLLGTTYSTSYTIPDNRLSGYTYAVCVLDRYGYEYSAVFIDTPTESLEGTTLIYPEDNAYLEAPFDFTWNASENATSYVIELAADADFNQMLYTAFCNTTSCSTSVFYDLPVDTQMYWRVRSCANGYDDGISESRAVTTTIMKITSPQNAEIDVSLTPTITWSIVDRDVTLEISTDNGFGTNSIVYSTVTNGGSFTVPAFTLNAFTTYYVRLCYERNGESLTTSVVEFRTMDIDPDIPQLTYPIDGGDFYSEDYLCVTPVEGLSSIRYELATSVSNLGGRTSFVENCATTAWHSSTKAGDMKISSNYLQEGTLYYMRIRGYYNSSSGTINTDWSSTISAYYRGDSSGLESIDSNTNDIQVINGELHITRSIGADIMVKAYTPAGADLGVFFDGTVDSGKTVIPLDNLEHGIYIIIVDQPEGRKALKAII